MKNARVWLLVLALIVSSLSGCGTGSTDAGTEDAVQQVSAVSGESVTLTAETLSGQIIWTSSDPEKLSVDGSGVAKALAGRGTVTVTATAGEKSRQFEVTLSQQTEFGAVSLPSGSEKIVISAWNGSYHDIDEAHMKLIADSGITLLIGLQDRWLSNNTMEEILDHAQKYGVSILKDMRNWDTLNVPEFVDHPALAGVLMYDEPNVLEFQELAEMKVAYDELVSEDKLFFVNLLPMLYDSSALFADAFKLAAENYEDAYIKQFVNMLDVPYISFDIYPLYENGTVNPIYYGNVESVAQVAKKSGREFWLSVLSAPHTVGAGRYITPSAQELRWQMAVGMTYGSKDLTHYVLCSHDEDYETMIEYGSFEPTEIYNAVSIANKELLAWDDVFTSFAWQGVSKVDVGEPNAMLELLRYDIPLSGAVTKIDSDRDLLVGVFDHEGQSGYMITNAGDTSEISAVSKLMNFTMKDAGVTLTLEGDYRCAAVISKGQITYVPVTDNTVSLTVEAYDGVFVIPVA